MKRTHPKDQALLSQTGALERIRAAGIPISPVTLRQLLRSGELPSLCLRGSSPRAWRRIPVEAVERLIAAQLHASPDAT